MLGIVPLSGDGDETQQGGGRPADLRGDSAARVRIAGLSRARSTWAVLPGRAFYLGSGRGPDPWRPGPWGDMPAAWGGRRSTWARVAPGPGRVCWADIEQGGWRGSQARAAPGAGRAAGVAGAGRLSRGCRRWCLALAAWWGGWLSWQRAGLVPGPRARAGPGRSWRAPWWAGRVCWAPCWALTLVNGGAIFWSAFGPAEDNLNHSQLQEVATWQRSKRQ